MDVENTTAANPVPRTSPSGLANRRAFVWLVVSQTLSLLSLGPWCMVAALSVMVFDAPGSDKMLEPWLFVGTIWLYPLFPIVCSVAAWLLYWKRKWKPAVVITSLPPAFALVAALWVAFEIVINS